MFLDPWVVVLVPNFNPLGFHSDSLAMLIEVLVTSASYHVELMWIPKLGENFFDVVLLHSEQSQVDLGANFADEGAIGDVSMR